MFPRLFSCPSYLNSAEKDTHLDLQQYIRRATIEAQSLLNELYAAREPLPGSALDQVGLREGLGIVEDFLAHGELGLALEHLLYMVTEPPLILSAESRLDIETAANLLNMSGALS